jgi:thioredoxin reductase (NADPH)
MLDNDAGGTIDARNTTHTIDCLIVGAGPAGLTAGLYLRRFHRDVRVVDGGKARALWIPRSHNVPGFPDGIPGHELMATLYRQFADVGGEVLTCEVTALERDGDGFIAEYGGQRVRARMVLLATGAKDHVAGWPGTVALRERGLLRQCPVCDGFEFTGQRIGVAGPGRHGAREALFIRHFSEHLFWLSDTDDDEPDESIAARLGEREVTRLKGRITDARPCKEVDEHGGENAGLDGGVEVELEGGGRHHFDVLYAAYGCRPRADLGAHLGAALDEGGNLVVDIKCRTSVKGLYAAGDVTGGLDQIVVAAGQAAIAATGIHNNL